jgi:hypothetical protein
MSEEAFYQRCMCVAFAMVLASLAFVICCGGIAILYESGALTKDKDQAEAKEEGR